ncbi:hypothetical protein [Luteimonas sp. MC1895]|uniref:hypothetical protein n=1 Tax=Luteimonas sp. MC1895 TaxID=2819513 RepID=UPI0018F0908B|nr:hypothetical protein [Luteimonas sp. MC1895]MBJ6979560.1 hypothetical protein [Luteimonas sp. MC1895]
MPAWILPLLAAFALLSASPAHARALVARMASVSTPVATLQGVQVRLDWPADAEVGELRITAQRADAPDLGQHFAALSWRCPLRRDGQGGWACAGELRQGRGAPLRLELALPPGRVSAALSGAGGSRLALRRDDAAPDLFAIDITRVPVAWAEALARRAWPGVRLGDGRLGGHLELRVPDAAPMRLTGELALDGGAFDSADGTQAGAGLGARLGIDWLAAEAGPQLAIDGELLGGELLFGSGYFVLPATPVPVRLRAHGVADGWALDAFLARDPGVLEVQGRADLDGAGVRALALSLRSAEAARLPERYLSGWLGQAGLTGLALTGGFDADVEIIDGALAGFALRARGLDVAAPDGRFRFQGLDGDVRLVSEGRVDSELRWQSAAIGAIPFGPARLPWRSSDGELHLREGVGIAILDGRLDIPALRLRPPGSKGPLLVEAALGVESLDMATLASALGLPAFPGTLSGHIPSARYVGDRLDFEGGVVARAFDGEVRVSSLAMERPFGVAPTLLADIALDGLDLQALTGVLEVGGISGRLHGRIDGLRLVDWEPAAFDAELHTEPRRGVRQRISQRAVQDISSVGDASFTASLQGQLLALFDDFGYRRIGISCRLANGVCTMAGLQPRGSGFVIVEGAGLPRLDIVGYNRRVDWKTLVERVVAAGSGEVSPVFD